LRSAALDRVAQDCSQAHFDSALAAALDAVVRAPGGRPQVAPS